MNIKIAIKSPSKTRGIEYVDYRVNDDIVVLKDLIENLVDIEIDKYENKELKVLSQDDINSMLEAGKVSFGFKYRENNTIDRMQAKDVATLAFFDGLYAVFIGDDEIENLEDKVNLKANVIVTLIRFTMLAGRYF